MIHEKKRERDQTPADSKPSRTKPAGPEDRAETEELVIVGIGASAGGLDALKKVLPGLPARAGMAYVIVQHLAPKPFTSLPTLLAKHTAMPVEMITNGMSVKPDTVYFAPPNKNVKISRNRLKLSAAASIGPKPSIDYFFNSLAEEKKDHAVGIILSGSGADGAHGIRAIKSNDGITMAQTADSAKFHSMPRAARDTGLVDLILPPEKIGQELEAALKYPNLIARAPLDTQLDDISTILGMLLQNTGVDFNEYKKTAMHRRISRRMVINKLHCIKDYAKFVEKHPTELFALYKDLLISVTSFFRDAKAFESLAREMRHLIARKPANAPLRIWVPGCSTGEEAYSIAILITEILGPDFRKNQIKIFATDVDDESVQVARKGIYPVATAMETESRRFEKHFSRRDNKVRVKKHIRDMVVLARQDLIKDAPFLHLDLISCRNLMIYLNSGLQDKLLSLFHFSLNPEGMLFLGKSELVDLRTDLFTSIDARWKIYRRNEVPTRELPKLLQTRYTSQLASHMADNAQQKENGVLPDYALIDALLGTLDASAVLVDDRDNILYIRGDLSPYFKIPEGSIRGNLNVVAMARPEIRFALQSLLHKSKKAAQSVTSNIVDLENTGREVRISVGPLSSKDQANRRIIIFMSLATSKTEPGIDATPESEDHKHFRELERELGVTREQLQDTIEELETTTEELQTLNEELQSANEELQVSNEELETSNEELQASNEELNTVNDELRAKSDEASELLQSLKISEKRYRLLVDNMNEALMLCEFAYDSGGRPAGLFIVQANRALEHLIGISDHEVPLRVGTSNLKELATPDMLDRMSHIAKGAPSQRFEQHLSRLDKDLTLSVYSLDKDLLGIVCHDDTERNRIQASLKELNESLERQVAERTELAESRARQLQNLSVELIEAEERERRRIAELLHDDLQQLLATARLQLQAACPNLEAQPELANVENLLVESIKKSRRLSHELSPPVLHHSGLFAALQWLVQQMEKQFALKVELEDETERKFELPDLKVFLYRATQELLFNVVKHAGVKTARVVISTSGNDLLLLVSDEGLGFNPDSLDTSAAKAGFGILSLKARAHHIGGSLEIESSPGKGSRFTLTVPINMSAAEESRHFKAKARKQNLPPTDQALCQSSGHLRVLVVDDHEVMRKGLIKLIAGQNGIQVIGDASDGMGAIKQARRLNPDVVVMDISMPEMDGVEATRRIKAELPAIRVIGLSMFHDEQITQTMLEAGAEAFVSKTASADKLIRVICGNPPDRQTTPARPNT